MPFIPDYLILRLRVGALGDNVVIRLWSWNVEDPDCQARFISAQDIWAFEFLL